MVRWIYSVCGYDLSTLDTTEAGTFTFTYTSSDALGNSSTAIRTIIVTEDQGQPFLTLVGETDVIHEAGTAYADAGAKAFNGDGSIANDNLAGEGEVDTQTPGSYSLAYNFEDADGNKAETLTRTVVVVDTTPPVITLGEFDGDTDFVRLFENQEYTDPGATAKDAVDGDVLVFSDLEEIPNALLSHAYTLGSNENQLDFSADTSLFNQTPNAIHLFRRELKFGSDGDFRNSNPGITRNNNFQNLWHGLFTAKRAGSMSFTPTALMTVQRFGLTLMEMDFSSVMVTKEMSESLGRTVDLGLFSRRVSTALLLVIYSGVVAQV